MSKKKIIRAHYEPRIEPGRASHDVLDWSDARAQQARFEVLLHHVDLVGKSLLDVGCGLGDLWAFLQAKGVRADYTGVDLLEKMALAARQKHPGGRFLCADVFDAQSLPGRRFDVVFCSGAFNLNLGNNREFLPRAAGRLLELTNEAVVFNLLHHRTATRYDHCFYYDPAEVRAALEPLGWNVQIVEDYLPNDFTVICRKPPRQRGPGGRAKKR
ncbi:MAG: class I SAM-dependent methyltransferase [Phycisphaerae bacterium]|nr:class I SAM-dependent methyltransferase [Phycisphaerae bacterium]